MTSSFIVKPFADRPAIQFAARQHLAVEGERAEHVYLISKGWAFRYRTDWKGRRQITAFFLPGDLCEAEWVAEPNVSQSIVAATTVRAESLVDLAGGAGLSQSVLSAALKELSRNSSRQAEWAFSLGRRSASGRIAHLFLDIFDRLNARGLVYGDQCVLPLTQIELADATGLTPVHVNRTLRELRTRGLVTLKNKTLRILQREGLEEMAGMGSEASPADVDVGAKAGLLLGMPAATMLRAN